MPNYVIPLVSKIASRLDDYLPSPFAGEIRGTVRELVTTNVNDNVLSGTKNISVVIAHTRLYKLHECNASHELNNAQNIVFNKLLLQ